MAGPIVVKNGCEDCAGKAVLIGFIMPMLTFFAVRRAKRLSK